MYLRNVYLLNPSVVTKSVTKMYDTVRLRLHGAVCNDECFENPEERYNHKTDVYSTVGYLRNIRVAAFSRSVSISGSLNKFIKGDNLQNITTTETRLGIQELSDLLKVPVGEADVYQVDVAANIEMDLPIAAYISCLGITNHYRMLSYPRTGLIYSNKTRKLLLYDKLEEMRFKNQKIPAEFNNKRLLRYEVSMKKKVRQEMKLNDLNASHLYNKVISKAFYKKWRDGYMKLKKKRDTKFNVNLESLTTLQFKNHLALLGIESIGGEDAVLSKVDLVREELKDENRFDANTKTKFCRNKRAIKEICTLPIITEPNEAITELDMKINQIYEEYIN